MSTTRRAFHAICRKDVPAAAGIDDFVADQASATKFFDRFGGRLDLAGKSVLDVGCGTGAVCIGAARQGARRVVGVDLQLIEVAREHLAAAGPGVEDRVELIETDGSLRELGEETFEVILSKDSFEHYPDPEGFVHVITRFLAPGGTLAIGFGPPWNAPTGGHIDYMTRLPWAHLLFPEKVIMQERRRFRPDDPALRFGDIVGGLNKITVRRFRALMAASGLECVFFATNVSASRAVAAMDVISRLGPLREYFTVNVYSIWRRVDDPGAPGG